MFIIKYLKHFPENMLNIFIYCLFVCEHVRHCLCITFRWKSEENLQTLFSLSCVVPESNLGYQASHIYILSHLLSLNTEILISRNLIICHLFLSKDWNVMQNNRWFNSNNSRIIIPDACDSFNFFVMYDYVSIIWVMCSSHKVNKCVKSPLKQMKLKRDFNALSWF